MKEFNYIAHAPQGIIHPFRGRNSSFAGVAHSVRYMPYVLTLLLLTSWGLRGTAQIIRWMMFCLVGRYVLFFSMSLLMCYFIYNSRKVWTILDFSLLDIIRYNFSAIITILMMINQFVIYSEWIVFERDKRMFIWISYTISYLTPICKLHFWLTQIGVQFFIHIICTKCPFNLIPFRKNVSRPTHQIIKLLHYSFCAWTHCTYPIKPYAIYDPHRATTNYWNQIDYTYMLRIGVCSFIRRCIFGVSFFIEAVFEWWSMCLPWILFKLLTGFVVFALVINSIWFGWWWWCKCICCGLTQVS